ncbi:MAG: HAD family hydrolase [Pseudomonadota bacterium]
MDHKLIVFDWNGTILSDAQQSLEAGNVCLEFYGAAPITLQKYRETFTFPIMHFYKKNGLSVDEVLAKKDEANEVFQDAYDALVTNARTRSGARDLLKWIKSQGFSCIILSNYRTEKIKAHLKRLKIDQYFSHVSAFGCEGATIVEVANKKERLSEFMVKRGYKPDDVILVGDSTEEPKIARALGLKSIGITDGYITTTRLRAANPDYIVNTLTEIKPILRQEWEA